MFMLKAGERAPDFTARATDGNTLRLSALRGRWVVLYFYPKAFTPGCTTETRLFRDNQRELSALGAQVVGVSLDNFETQCRFAGAESVTFPLVADEDKRISREYGVIWPLLSLDKRVTFVIDPEGMVRAVFRHEFQVVKHLDDVAGFLKKQRAAS
jgi:peroxiredoxin Q/BCP